MTDLQILHAVAFHGEMANSTLRVAPSLGKSAVFSRDMEHRFKLARHWGAGHRFCNFVLLNPSTADETKNDPTVERCERRARDWGYDGLAVTNLFALRSTDPAALRTHPDPVGGGNTAAILEVAKASALVVCGWGNHGTLNHRGKSVRCVLESAGVKLHYLRMAKSGQPCHPLYVPYSEKPKEWL